MILKANVTGFAFSTFLWMYFHYCCSYILFKFILVVFGVVFLFTCLNFLCWFFFFFFCIFLVTCLPFFMLVFVVVLRSAIICKQVYYCVCSFNVKRCKSETPVSRFYHFRKICFFFCCKIVYMLNYTLNTLHHTYTVSSGLCI